MTARGRIWPTATTRLAGVIGDPVRHSLSPVLHNAAFQALDLDWAFVAWEVPEGEVVPAMAGVRALGVDGLSVTMPHKGVVAAAVDRLTTTAERLGAVNTVVREGSALAGHNTDGPGLIDALRYDEGVEPAGMRCLVRGAGGAARAVILALAEVGAAQVVVWARDVASAEAAASLAGPSGAIGGPKAVEAADLVVNATPLGMRPGEDLPVPIESLREGQVVVDLVYSPLHTPLLAAVKARGGVAVSGLGMLLHQAGHAFRLWTGEEPPLGVMSAAALGAMAAAGIED